MGPLSGFRVVEMAGIGPCPFAGMILSDLGADVIRVDRPRFGESVAAGAASKKEVLGRGKRSIAIDLKDERGRVAVERLILTADAVIEGFRPGVMERLGLDPRALLEKKPSLVVGRMTGFGQAGPYADRAGHDINYISLSGVLSQIGREGSSPTLPLNLVGDFGGGGMLLVVGVLAGLLRAKTNGIGDIVDASMVDGSSLLAAMIHGFVAEGMWQESRGTNLLDGGAPFYDVYETSDGGYISIGALEPQFYLELLDLLALSDHPAFKRQYDRSNWPEMRRVFSVAFLSATRAEWESRAEGRDCCLTPVLGLTEALEHPNNLHRNGFVTVEGVRQPAPAPRFESYLDQTPESAPLVGADTEALLQDLGYTSKQIDGLLSAKVCFRPVR